MPNPVQWEEADDHLGKAEKLLSILCEIPIIVLAIYRWLANKLRKVFLNYFLFRCGRGKKIIQEMRLLGHYCINHPENSGSLSGSSGCTGQKKWSRKPWVLKNSSSDLFLHGTCCLYLGGVTILETCSFFLLSYKFSRVSSWSFYPKASATTLKFVCDWCGSTSLPSRAVRYLGHASRRDKARLSQGWTVRFHFLNDCSNQWAIKQERSYTTGWVCKAKQLKQHFVRAVILLEYFRQTLRTPTRSGDQSPSPPSSGSHWGLGTGQLFHC